MRIVQTTWGEGYRQMVAANTFLRDGGTTAIAVALSGRPGGMALFNVSEPARPAELARIVRPDLAEANRVHIHRYGSHGTFALLPLEQSRGAIGVIELGQNLISLRNDSVKVVEMPGAAPTYCLSPIGSRWLYSFSSQTSALFIYELSFNEN